MLASEIPARSVLIETPKPCTANAASDNVVVQRVVQRDQHLACVRHMAPPPNPLGAYIYRRASGAPERKYLAVQLEIGACPGE